MKCYFENIEEFSKIRYRCVFCGAKLKVIFINFSRSSQHVPIIKSKEKEGKFEFHMTHTIPGLTLESDVEIDVKTNIVRFDSPSRKDRSTKSLDYYYIEQTFENLGPHVELYCSSKSCGLNYCISSDHFKCESIEDDPSSWRIRNVRLYMESFVVDKLWVQNDFIFNSTNIYPQANPDCDPIRAKLINLEGMSKDKIITRIKTLVTFS